MSKKLEKQSKKSIIGYLDSDTFDDVPVDFNSDSLSRWGNKLEEKFDDNELYHNNLHRGRRLKAEQIDCSILHSYQDMLVTTGRNMHQDFRDFDSLPADRTEIFTIESDDAFRRLQPVTSTIVHKRVKARKY